MCKEVTLSEGQLETIGFVAVSIELIFGNSSPSKGALLTQLLLNSEPGYSGGRPLRMVEQSYCILLNVVLRSHSCRILMAKPLTRPLSHL